MHVSSVLSTLSGVYGGLTYSLEKGGTLAIGFIRAILEVGYCTVILMVRLPF